MDNPDKQNSAPSSQAGPIHSVLMSAGNFSNTVLNDEQLKAYWPTLSDEDKRRYQLMTDKEVVLNADTNEEEVDHAV